MTTNNSQNEPLLSPHHDHHHKSPWPLLKRQLSIAVTCVGILTVVSTQYWASQHANVVLSSATPLMPDKDDFIADSVMEFRKGPGVGHNKGEEIHDGNSNKEDPGLDFHGTPLHVVFSTSCHEQMHWESFVFFYHAWKVHQPGTVTRIASGCSDSEAEEARKFHEQAIQPMSDRFYLHLTPDFSKIRLPEKKGGGSYKYMNKPFGLRSWMENVLQMNSTGRPKGVEDGVVILMDPDMVLLRPLVHDFSNEDVIWVEDNPATTMVKHGYPMAQQDGYLGNQWMYIDGAFVTGDPNIGKPKDPSGPKHWNTGPPYLATVKDMYDIVTLWTEYAPRVDHINPGLFAEMQGFIWATYKLSLPHTLLKSIVVSTTVSQHREGWAYVDALPDNQVCAPPASAKLPIGLHYCKRYALGPDFFFSKYRLKKNFLQCSTPLLMPPPLDIGTQSDYYIAPPPAKNPKKVQDREKKSFSKKQAKREAFMLCGMISAVNEAATHFKQHMCDGEEANFQKIYTIANNPGNFW